MHSWDLSKNNATHRINIKECILSHFRHMQEREIIEDIHLLIRTVNVEILTIEIKLAARRSGTIKHLCLLKECMLCDNINIRPLFYSLLVARDVSKNTWIT